MGLTYNQFEMSNAKAQMPNIKILLLKNKNPFLVTLNHALNQVQGLYDFRVYWIRC
jgi:hypothetical protein